MEHNIAYFYDFAVSDMKNVRFAEIGCWKGVSVIYLTKKLISRNTPFEVVAVDLWDLFDGNSNGEGLQKESWNIFNNNISKEGLSDLISIIKNESSVSSSFFADGYFDVVFIDASHDYESVKRDITSWLPKVRKGGLIGGHDYSDSEGVRKSVHEIFGNDVNIIHGIWMKSV